MYIYSPILQSLHLRFYTVSIQHMTALAEKQGELWCQLIAILSQSQQNQLHMASKRHPTKVLSCMHLNMMASKVRFQEYGWTVMANTVATPTPEGGKVSPISNFNF